VIKDVSRQEFFRLEKIGLSVMMTSSSRRCHSISPGKSTSCRLRARIRRPTTLLEIRVYLKRSTDLKHVSRGLSSVHKGRSQVGRGICPVRIFYRLGGFSRCGRPHFLVQKNFGFFEIFGASSRTRD